MTLAAPLRFRGLDVEVPGRTLVADADLTVHPGEIVALLGPSGSGKTSILNVAAGIRPASAGEVSVAGFAMSRASPDARSNHRLRRIGLVFQFSELLPELTAGENVGLPLLLAGESRDAADAATAEALSRVGLAGCEGRWPDSLSGGEAQRAAVARAIVARPPLLLADEPTGALDEENSQGIGRLFQSVAKETACGLLVGTHDPVMASFADRIVRIRDGTLVAAQA